VCVGPAIAILARLVVDRAAAAQERRVRLLEDPPHHRIKQARRLAEDAHPVRPLHSALIRPGAKIAEMPEDIGCPGRQILGMQPSCLGPRRRRSLAAARFRQVETGPPGAAPGHARRQARTVPDAAILSAALWR